MNSFFVKAKQEGFPRLRDRMELWQLLARITVRKTLHQRRGIRTHKRGGRHANSDRATDLNNLAAQEPTPAMLAAINDECQRLMGTLTEELRWVARLKLEGYTNREIATALGRVERTVERKLDRIRQTWIEEVESP